MRRIAIVMALVLTGCATNGSGGAHAHQVLVDYSPDDFPASFFGYFPRVVEAHPGDTVDFHQTWTGEPHTVTLGTMLQPIGDKMRPLLLHRKPLTDDVDTSIYGVPSVFPDTNGTGNDNIVLNQTASQPCYVKAGPLPSGGECPKTQPAFDGTQAFYNSGYIPYRGRKSNEFALPLSKAVKPGDYFYYCLLHGPGMGGFVRVKPTGESLASPKGLHDRDLEAGRRLAEKARRVAAKPTFRLPGSDIQVGVFTDAVNNGLAHPVSTNQFFPSAFHTKVGQPVTWSFLDGPGHTVSFAVPKYLPAMLFRPDGSVEVNSKSINAVGGPGYPQTEEPAPDNGFAVDVGDYDGSHFLSSGFPDGRMRYSVTFTKPGTYPYACLIHPLMLGKIVVSR